MRNWAANVLAMTALAQLPTVGGFSVINNSPITRQRTDLRRSPLFQFPSGAHGKQNRSLSFETSRRLGRKSTRFHARMLSIVGKIRRSVMLMGASVMIWFCAAGVWRVPSHASSAPAEALQPKNILSPSLEKIVDRYVQEHMFDDDVYDPVESLYREAMGDKVKGTYPKALKETTSSVLGQEGFQAEKASSSNGIGDTIMSVVGFLQRKGLSETTAILLLAGSFVVGVPTLLLVAVTMIGSQSKRQIKRVMKKRYGDTYTVDATIKVEEDVEIADDDDDDDDDDNDDDDDEESNDDNKKDDDK